MAADDDFEIYAASILNVSPFGRRVSGYGIYLGQGAVLTVAHVVGPWTLLDSPTISIAGKEVPAQIIKKGAFPKLDLALLVIDEDAGLPLSVRLRQNRLCRTAPPAGTSVVIVSPREIVRSQTVPVNTVAAKYWSQFSTLVSEPHGSGSAVCRRRKKMYRRYYECCCAKGIHLQNGASASFTHYNLGS